MFRPLTQWIKRLIFGSPKPEVSDLKLSPKVADVGEKVTASVEIANPDRTDGEITLRFFVDDELVDEKAEKIRAGKRKRTQFTWTFDEIGEYEVKIEGLPPEKVSVLEVPGLHFDHESWKVFHKIVSSAEKKVDLATGTLSPEGLNLITSKLNPDVQLRIINNRTGGGGYDGLREEIDLEKQLKRCKRFHAKLCIVDDKVALIGSSNMTRGSMGGPEGRSGSVEANIVVTDDDIVKQASSLFDAVWSKKKEVSGPTEDSEFLSSARGIPMKVKDLIAKAEDEVTIIVPPLFDSREGYKSIPNFVRDLNPDVMLKIITSHSVPKNYVNLIEEMEGWDKTEVKLVKDRIHAKVYVIDWKTAVVSSANLEFTSWVSSLEAGVITEEKEHLRKVKDKVDELESREAEINIKAERGIPPVASDEDVRSIEFLFDTEGKQLLPDLAAEKIEYQYLPPKEFFTNLIRLLEKEHLLEDWRAELKENILLESQNLSYYITLDKLLRYGGFILANSVGTGKSYVACKVMREYLTRYPERKCLLITPPRIESEWRSSQDQEGYLEEFGISNQVEYLSMGILQKPPWGEKGENNFCFDYREHEGKYSLIVVDEIHHYRNNSNRRNNLINLITGNPDADVLCIGATPINLGPEDLFREIDLFHRGNNIEKFEEQGMEKIYSDTKSELKEVEGLRFSPELLENIKNIASEFSLKITWRVLQEYFREDLEALKEGSSKYEEPEVNGVPYSYPREFREQIFDEIIPFLEKLNYEPAKIWNGQGYQDDKNLIFWHRWRLYKRLESSLYAFYKSLRNLSKRFQIYKETLKKTLSEGSSPLSALDIGEYKNILNEKKFKVALKTFSEFDENQKRIIVENLGEDCEIIEDMLKTLEQTIGKPEDHPFKDDKKVSKLKNVLKENLENGRPTVVFSQWADTIDYLYNSLEDDFDKINYIHGKTENSSEKMKNRFNEGEIDILLTTDIMGEGINLPRADSVINFDLPYNPAILVQRAGRALRITRPKKIYLLNFSPDEEIDKELELMKRLDLRLNTILNLVGLDFVVWALEEKEIEEWHEEEKERYLDLYGRRREEIASTNPDDLFSDTVPEESHLDRILRKAIKKHNITITKELVGEAGVEPPIFTTLVDGDNLFLITGIGKGLKTVGELKPSIKESDNPIEMKLSPDDQSRIGELLKKAKVELDIERVAKQKLGRREKKILDKIRRCGDRLNDPSMKEVLKRDRDLIEKSALPPHEVDRVEERIIEIDKIPAFIADIDDQVREMNEWQELEDISRKKPTSRELKPIALIKYVGD